MTSSERKRSRRPGVSTQSGSRQSPSGRLPAAREDVRETYRCRTRCPCASTLRPFVCSQTDISWRTRSSVSEDGMLVIMPSRAPELLGDRPHLGAGGRPDPERSEEHTSEPQSLMRNSYAVFCLKKKQYTQRQKQYVTRLTY